MQMYRQDQPKPLIPVPSVLQGFIIMVIFIFTGVVFSFAYGLMVDKIQDSIIDTGMYDQISDEWKAGLTSSDAALNVFYAMMWGIPILGVLIFFLTIVYRNTYDEATTYGY